VVREVGGKEGGKKLQQPNMGGKSHGKIAAGLNGWQGAGVCKGGEKRAHTGVRRGHRVVVVRGEKSLRLLAKKARCRGKNSVKKR